MVQNPTNNWLWYLFQSSSVIVENGFGIGPPVFRIKISVSLFLSMNFFTLSKFDVSISLLDAAKTSISIDFNESEIALPIPREPPKTIALVLLLLEISSN